MNQKELAAALNVSSTAIGLWVKEGMPCKSPGKQGRPAIYDLAECLDWLQSNGKGYSVRRDRPGYATAVFNTPAPTSPAASLPPEPQDITERLVAERMRGAEMALDYIAENFPLLASALIRFCDISPSKAVEITFTQLDTIICTTRMELDIPFREPEHPKIQAYLDGDRAELEESAAALVDLWDLEPSKTPESAATA